MNASIGPVQPPNSALVLINLFVLPGEEEPILGDLQEEFSQQASTSGLSSARRWYWRQTLKTVVHLALLGFRTAPWSTAAAIAGGLLLRKVLGHLVEPTIFAVIERYQMPENHFAAYKFLATTGIDMGWLLTFFLSGLLVAVVAKGREMIATVSLGLYLAVLVFTAIVATLAKLGFDEFLWHFTWSFADCFAVVLAGAIVRGRRTSPSALSRS